MQAPEPPETLLHGAQAAFDAGRVQQALDAARSLDTDAVPAALRIEARRLRALVAFGLGEFDEAAAAAQALLKQLGDHALTYPSRLPVLAVSVVAAGELARFDQALGHLQQMLSAASRAGSLDAYVRARGTAATCFELLGDPWAGQRLLSELLGLFQGLPGEAVLEAATRHHHAAVCLRIARLAHDAGDAAGCADSLDHAEASLQRAGEIALTHGAALPDSAADLCACEAALLRGDAAAAAVQLQTALDKAQAARLPASVRLLRVVLAEALNCKGEPERALALLSQVEPQLRDGHGLGLRIRCLRQLQLACAATGAHEQALAHAARARQLEQSLLYRQSSAQSRFLRTRLELEHLYRYRASASRGITSRPGSLTAPAPLDGGAKSAH